MLLHACSSSMGTFVNLGRLSRWEELPRSSCCIEARDRRRGLDTCRFGSIEKKRPLDTFSHLVLRTSPPPLPPSANPSSFPSTYPHHLVHLIIITHQHATTTSRYTLQPGRCVIHVHRGVGHAAGGRRVVVAGYGREEEAAVKIGAEDRV